MAERFLPLAKAGSLLPLAVRFRALAIARALRPGLRLPLPGAFAFEVCGFLASATAFFLGCAVTLFLVGRTARFRGATGNLFLAGAITSFLLFTHLFPLLWISSARGAGGVR